MGEYYRYVEIVTLVPLGAILGLGVMTVYVAAFLVRDLARTTSPGFTVAHAAFLGLMATLAIIRVYVWPKVWMKEVVIPTLLAYQTAKRNLLDGVRAIEKAVKLEKPAGTVSVLTLSLLLAVGGPGSAIAALEPPATPPPADLAQKVNDLTTRITNLEQAAKVVDPMKSVNARLETIQQQVTTASRHLSEIASNTKAGWLTIFLVLAGTVLFLFGAITLWRAPRLEQAVGGIHNAVAEMKTVATALRASGPSPTITRIEPTSGPVTGGFAITISGSTFQANSTVRMRGNFATNVEVRSAGEIRAIAPSGTPGQAEVVVQNPDGARNATPVYLTYTMPPPVVAGITPGEGIFDVWGANFQRGGVVQFDGIDVVTTFASENHFALQAVARGSGEVTVTVTNPDGNQTQLLWRWS